MVGYYLPFSELDYLLRTYYGRCHEYYYYDRVVYNFQCITGCTLLDGLYGPETECALSNYLCKVYHRF